MTYPPDFILQFSNPESRNVIYTSNILQGDEFVLTHQPWTTNYRCLVVPWDTKVTIKIKGIPPHASHRDILIPLLASHCNIQTYCFDEESGTCTVNAFLSNIEAIPKETYLGLPHQNSDGRTLHAYPIIFETTTFTEDQHTTNSTPSYTAELFGVDPNVLQEAYEELWKAEDALNGRNNLSTSDNTDSFDYSNYKPASPDRQSYESMSSGYSDVNPKCGEQIYQQLHSLSNQITLQF